MPGIIHYRPMEGGDASVVSEFCICIFDEFVAASCTQEGRQTFVDDASTEKLSERANTHYFILALDEEKIVGVADMQKDGYLKLLFVERDYQNRGIGRKLLSLCIEAATIEGNRPSTITVKSAVNSVSYYENLGFKKDDDAQEIKGISFVPMSLKLDI